MTGEIDYSINTLPIDATVVPDPDTGINTYSLSYNPTVLTYGFTVQYSLLYANSFVHEVPDLFKRLDSRLRGHLQLARFRHWAVRARRVDPHHDRRDRPVALLHRPIF